MCHPLVTTGTKEEKMDKTSVVTGPDKVMGSWFGGTVMYTRIRVFSSEGLGQKLWVTRVTKFPETSTLYTLGLLTNTGRSGSLPLLVVV